MVFPKVYCRIAYRQKSIGILFNNIIGGKNLNMVTLKQQSGEDLSPSLIVTDAHY